MLPVLDINTSGDLGLVITVLVIILLVMLIIYFAKRT